jgi:3'(2'), 5'-bisphosphate nucleotidase
MKSVKTSLFLIAATLFMSGSAMAQEKKVEAKPNIVEPFTVATSRSYHDSMLQEFSAKLQERYGKVEFLKKGSALKFFDLAAGNVAVYPRFAPTMEWDIAAGQIILEEAGGKVLDLSGKTMLYNKESMKVTAFIATGNGHPFID